MPFVLDCSFITLEDKPMNELTILWYETDKKESFKDYKFVQTLGIDKMINLTLNHTSGEVDMSINDFFSKDQKTIINRCEMFKELMEDSELFNGLNNNFEMLTQISDLRKEKEHSQNNESMLYSIKELELYVDYIVGMHTLFVNHPVKSYFLLKLKNEIDSIFFSEDFSSVCNDVNQQSHSIKHINSITIGVNLNAQLQPIEAGVIKVNETRYVSGSFIDKVLRINSVDSDYVCMASMIPSTKELSQDEFAVLRSSLNNALNKVFSSALKSWKRIVRKYIVDSLDRFWALTFEWHFVEACMQLLQSLNKNGYNLCEPLFGENEEIFGLYNPLLATISDKRVVLNDIKINNSIFILTGPNQGGKSIFTQAIGILYAMLHLGLPLPANQAVVCPVDAIYTHFMDTSDRNYRYGRFESECQEIQSISQHITDSSLFLFDEAFSSTSADEAIVISKEILYAFSEIGAKGIWTTHLHGLCCIADEEPNGKSRISNLTAELCEESHERLYRIVKGAKYGSSYAGDIAQKYHLTKTEIIENRNILN